MLSVKEQTTAFLSSLFSRLKVEDAQLRAEWISLHGPTTLPVFEERLRVASLHFWTHLTVTSAAALVCEVAGDGFLFDVAATEAATGQKIGPADMLMGRLQGLQLSSN